MNPLTQLVWARLSQVDSLSFVSTSHADQATGWTGKATGRVDVRALPNGCLLFVESGSWSTPPGKVFQFTNTYRWSVDGDRLKLEHLRFGPDRPVYLFDLIPSGERTMISDGAHVCSEDLYTASLELSDDVIALTWDITGPKLNERIAYRYWCEKCLPD